MKLEEVKKQQNIFKSNMKKMSGGKFFFYVKIYNY